jgi:hypothetical protein
MGLIKEFGADALSRSFASAADGPVFECQLIPLVGRGRVRVHYNWLYSALNCDAGLNTDTDTDFIWTVHKLDGTAVALSPSQPHFGVTLFASVQPHSDYLVQLQMSGSGDWITGAGGDERLTMTELGFLTINLKGFNGQYIAVSELPSWGQVGGGGDPLFGYCLESTSASPVPPTNLFVGITAALQPTLRLPLSIQLTEPDIRDALVSQKLPDPGTLARRIAIALAGPAAPG